MLLVAVPLEIFIIAIIAVLLVALAVMIFINEKKKRNLYITQIMYKLMQEKMENVEHNNKNSLYDIKFRFNNKNFFLKVHKGGSKRGFIMTNPTTIYETTYSNANGPTTSSEVASKLTPFLVEPRDGVKIILIKENLLRMTKYINENEIVEVKYNVPAFNTYLIQNKDFDSFIELIKNVKKK